MVGIPDYEPDKWVILKIDNKGEIVYKVLAGWSGSYLYGQSWKLNSGIVSIEKRKDYYLFEGYTGSVYKCRFNSYGINAITIDILENLKNKVKDIDNVSIEMLDYNQVDNLKAIIPFSYIA